MKNATSSNIKRDGDILNLQSLFPEQITSQTSLGGHASDVWLVETESNEYVVRSSGVDVTIDAPFLWACRNLFGIELSRTFCIESINNSLRHFTKNISIPNVLGKAIIDGRQVIVVEKIDGVNSKFLNTPSEMMEDFGKSIAEIHSHKFFECGAPNGDLRYSLEEFPQKLMNALKILSSRYYLLNTDITNRVDFNCSIALKCRYLSLPLTSCSIWIHDSFLQMVNE